MIWHWRIFFSALFLSAIGLLPVLGASVTGTVELAGSRDPGLRKHKDYSGVVIWLERSNGSAGTVRPLARGVEMTQRNKKFIPHVLAIPVGTRVDFPNFDPIFHNAFSNFSGQLFDVGLYPPGTSRSVLFKRPGIVRVFCNIHPTMSAVIAVLQTSWFAVSNSTGKFAISGVPKGDYQLNVFHERASQETLDKLKRKIVVETADVILPPLNISESGYLPTPHKNKYGKDYPPVPDEHVIYPGARQ